MTNSIRDSDIASEAFGLAARGLVVIPVPRPRPGVTPGQVGDGKTPSIKWARYQTERPTQAEMRTWFARPQNLAIITGAISGVVVVDPDSPEALAWVRRRLPYTPWQVKTSRGYHLYYGHPGVPVRNKARLNTGDGRIALDVRGDGGYVIGPGSVHASGVVYEYAGDWTVERSRLPRFWPGWIARPERRPAATPKPGPRPTGNVVDRARRYLARVPKPEIGHGSDTATLYAACRLVRGFDVPEHDAVELLCEWAGNRPGWTPDWIAHKVQSALRYGTEPIGALR